MWKIPDKYTIKEDISIRINLTHGKITKIFSKIAIWNRKGFCQYKKYPSKKPGMSTHSLLKVNFHLHFKYLHNVWPIAIHVWILFCMPFSQQHTVLHFGRLFLVEKSRLTSVEPRLMEMLLMGIGKFLLQIYEKLLFFGSLLNACFLSFYIPYGSSILGQLLDLISPPKINLFLAQIQILWPIKHGILY